MVRSWFFSAVSFIVDTTVFFICCIISSGLKDTLEPGWADGGATEGDGSGAWDVV